MDATAVSSGGSGQGSRSASRAGRKSGTPGWLPIEGLVAYHAMNHADEKVSESHEQERHVNAKTFFDAAIVKMDDMGLWTPASERTSGPKLPSDSVRVRDGKSIYIRGKNLKQWLTKLLPTFEELWRNPHEPKSYDFIPSGVDPLAWWEECETKAFDNVKEGNPDASIPKELLLTFRYACPDSPHASLTPHAGVNNDARLFFSQYRDRRLIIDPEPRKQECNKGPTRQQQRANAAAAAALGQDPRAPGNVVIARQPLHKPAPDGAPTFTEQWMARLGFGIEQYLAQSLGVDFTNAPAAPIFASQGNAPSTTPSAPSATTVNPTTREANLRGDESSGGGGEGDRDESEPTLLSDDVSGEVVRPVHGGGVVELVLLHAFESLPLGVNLVLVATAAFVAAGTGTRARPREDGVLQLDECRRVMPKRALHALHALRLFAC